MVRTSTVPRKKDDMSSLSSSGPYRCKMHSGSYIHVVLYDVEDLRAWSLDGASALIHLTRTQVSRTPSGLTVDEFPCS
jgi:hypothetical protein